jgi:predicted transcriptional regulator
MQVGDIMTRVIFSCDTHATLEDIARVMWDHDCGYVPIVNEDDNKLSGVVTDRDVAMAAYNHGKRLADIPVSAVMSERLHACAPDASVELAHEIMRSAEIRRLPVVEQGSGKLVGLVTWSDLLEAARRESSKAAAAALKNQVIETLEATVVAKK